MGTDGEDRSGGRTVTLHSSWTGIGFAIGGAALLAAFVVSMVVYAGVNAGTVVFAIIALLVVIVVLFDLPIAADLNGEGVVRRSLLRHQKLAWGDITRVTRARVGVLRMPHHQRTGGLVAVKKRHHYLLVDRAESPQEFDAVLDAVGEWRNVLFVDESLRPPADQSPTWLYRHHRWRPGSRHDA